MALSLESQSYLISGMATNASGNELINAIQNQLALSPLSYISLQDALTDDAVAANFQACILGTYALSPRDIQFVSDGFSLSASALASVLSNLAGGIQNRPPLSNNAPVNVSMPNGFSVALSSIGPAQQQIIQLTEPAGSTFASTGPGKYFELFTGGNSNQYYVWYSVIGGSNTDPAPAGLIGIRVNIAAGASPTAVALATNVAILANAQAVTSSASGAVVTVVPAVVSTVVVVPVFSVPAGTYSAAQLVTITSATPGASIFYTVDGSNPTYMSTPYVGPVTIGVTETLKAIAIKSGSANSPAASAAYTISASPGLATQVVFTTQPSSAAQGVVFGTQPIVTIRDASNATVTTGPDATALITLSLFSGTGVLAGTVTKAAVAGVADFSGDGLNISLYGNKVIAATKSATAGPGSTGVLIGYSNILNISNGLAAVNLGAASTYRLLAESGISTTAGTSIIGDIAVSPIASTAITGFSLVLDGSGTFSTSSLVTGHVFAANYASPTPANLTSAVSAMGAAYTDAAGRTSPDFTNLGSGEIGGLTLTPGLYKWTTGVTISNNVTITGGPNDVFIFQVAGTLGLSTGKSVILSGGVVPSNIFWQVSGAVTLGVSSVFQGVILGQTSIAIQTTAVLHGSLYAQTAITLDDDIISA